jgi:hypothetical protein
VNGNTVVNSDLFANNNEYGTIDVSAGDSVYISGQTDTTGSAYNVSLFWTGDLGTIYNDYQPGVTISAASYTHTILVGDGIMNVSLSTD